MGIFWLWFALAAALGHGVLPQLPEAVGCALGAKRRLLHCQFTAYRREGPRSLRSRFGSDSPPVDLDRFYIAERRECFYLIVSALVPYKNIQLAIAAFNRLRLPLRIVGDGPFRKTLENRPVPTSNFSVGLTIEVSRLCMPSARRFPRRGGFRHRAVGGASERPTGDRLW